MDRWQPDEIIRKYFLPDSSFVADRDQRERFGERRQDRTTAGSRVRLGHLRTYLLTPAVQEIRQRIR